MAELNPESDDGIDGKSDERSATRLYPVRVPALYISNFLKPEWGGIVSGSISLSHRSNFNSVGEASNIESWLNQPVEALPILDMALQASGVESDGLQTDPNQELGAVELRVI